MWLTNVVTIEHLSAQTATDRKRQYAVPGQIRTYAGGRQRSVGSFGMARSWSFTLVELTQGQYETLTGWMDVGVTVFARDHRGQSMYGTFFSLDVGENPSQTWQYATYTADVTLQAVDVVEGV
jgi:hypothetical protein